MSAIGPKQTSAEIFSYVAIFRTPSTTVNPKMLDLSKTQNFPETSKEQLFSTRLWKRRPGDTITVSTNFAYIIWSAIPQWAIEQSPPLFFTVQQAPFH
jgi:hypothetical protein